MAYTNLVAIIFALSGLYIFYKKGRVPNKIPIALIVAFGVALGLCSDAPALVSQLLAFGAVFILGFICFAIWRDFGGGTAKVFSVIALLTPISFLPYIVISIFMSYIALLVFDNIYWKIKNQKSALLSNFAGLSLLIASIIVAMPSAWLNVLHH